jgi:dTDP-4-amino-4,6-dideoxygalactose transaminase
LLPYLHELDASRWYSNHGALNHRFASRLADQLGGTVSEQIVTASNATAALTATLLALDLPPGSPCLMPAWTFAASGHAVVQAGLTPRFLDVNLEDGAVTPAAAQSIVRATPRSAATVLLAVSPFGLPVDVGGWCAFQRETGIPVVLDAAAAFDTVRVSPIPTVVSLHATKVFGIGEGAFVACSDEARSRAIRERINFGFADSREAVVPAMNAKLSEYGAAIGLAALSAWPGMRAAYRRVALDYAEAFRSEPSIRVQRGYGEEFVSATAIIRVPPDRLTAVEDALALGSIGSRRWWGDGLTKQRAFARYASGPLPATDAHAASTIGLPSWPDLSTDAIARIAGIVATACRS